MRSHAGLWRNAEGGAGMAGAGSCRGPLPARPGRRCTEAAGKSLCDFPECFRGVGERRGSGERSQPPDSAAERCRENYPRPPRPRADPEGRPAASGRRAMPVIRSPDRRTGHAVEGMDVPACRQETVAAVRNSWLIITPPPFPECVDLRTSRCAGRRTGCECPDCDARSFSLAGVAVPIGNRKLATGKRYNS